MQIRPSFIVLCLLCTLLLPGGVHAVPESFDERTFDAPLDGLSIELDGSGSREVSAWDGDRWTPWQELHVEDEQDPALRESNMVLFPHAATRVRLKGGGVAQDRIHPIRISRAPAQFLVAATAGTSTPHILSRKEWGADESLLVAAGSSSIPANAPSESNDNAGTAAPSVREQDCRDAYKQYPSEFVASTPVTDNVRGEKLRWPQQYSQQIRLLVVHHTAMSVAGDSRSGLERMRALYQYHAQNRAWGDIGYHYVIDEKGQIYEGRAGGDSVVGGHVYCNNVGTIGVAMMGNFDIEQPTQEQTRGLQSLLALLAGKYRVELQHNVLFHGKSLPSIVGHRQLVSTDCPGTAVWSALDQIRDHVGTGKTDAAVQYPSFDVPKPAEDVPKVWEISPGIVTGEDGLAALAETLIEGRPGGEVVLPIFFRAARKSYNHNTRIARLTRSAGLEIWQEFDGKFTAVRGDLRIPVRYLKQGESVVLRVKVRLPMSRGNSTLKVGSIQYVFSAEGKSVRGRQIVNTSGLGQLDENPAPSSSTSRVTLQPPPSSVSSAIQTAPAASADTVRILLSAATGNPQISATDALLVNGSRTASTAMKLKQNGSLCETDTRISGTVIRISTDSVLTVDAANGAHRYRGTIECRIVDGHLVLINELPLEDYLMGLGEEPDTELYEKQRAFAIAARTYALYYLDGAHRKFPGLPYDGSDSPATFQLYRGYGFELQNPQWIRAAQSTARQVLTYRGNVIKPPYFSSDDGRTRTPTEAGWRDFPFAEIFTSKNDPWCSGMSLRGHGVGMSGCGALGQAKEGKTGEQILQYYYPGTIIEDRR